MKQALLYEKIDDNSIKCLLCSHNCIIKDDKFGICKVRKNIKGELYSLNYDRVAAIHTDPIEKKPLYHFLPASISFSIATMGCNFQCKFCQNYSISMVQNENQIYGDSKSPEQLIEQALKCNSKSISYTYTEPTIYFELMFETAKLAKENNIKNVMVTNGYMSEPAFEMMAPYLDAANIDLKAFSENFYKKYCGSKLFPVLDTIKRMKKNGIWIELTTLIIPDLNSEEHEIKELISFILNLDENIPWHVSRFFPNYKFSDASSTNPEMIYEFLEIGKKMGLKYIYSGNTLGDKWSDTYCPNCDSILIKRNGYNTKILNTSKGICYKCGNSIPGVW